MLKLGRKIVMFNCSRILCSLLRTSKSTLKCFTTFCAPPQKRLAAVLPINFHFGIFTSSTADAKNLSHADLLERLKFAAERNNSESRSCFNDLVVDRATERSKGDYFRWLKFEIQIRCFCKRKRVLLADERAEAVRKAKNWISRMEK